MSETDISQTIDSQPESWCVLLNEKEAPPELTDSISKATGRVVVASMQFEVTPETKPLIDEVIGAHERGADTTVRFDRVARKHIRAGDSQAWLLRGRTVYHRGNKPELKEHNNNRESVFKRLGKLGILDRNFHKRGKFKLLSHDHIKMVIADSIAFLGTMNLRAIDFQISNFMMKITDTRIVDAIKEVSDLIDQGMLRKDLRREFVAPNGHSKIELLVDAGNKYQSVIYDRGVEMARSLRSGDEFTFISQWPPIKTMVFGKIVSRLTHKTDQRFFGKIYSKLFNTTKPQVKGKFLMSPEEYHHPIKGAGRILQRSIEKKYGDNSNIQIKNLARQTHAKALLIKRADGSREVLYGSHNFTRFTVRNGTREMAMWTDDPVVVDKIVTFLQNLENE